MKLGNQLRKALFVLVLGISVMSCHRARIIPADTLSDIYADMFLADQWVLNHTYARRQADTTLFYEPIFKKYGYTTVDYQASVDHYLYNTDKFAKILNNASNKLEKEMKRLKKIDDILDKRIKWKPYIGHSFKMADSLAWKEDTLIYWPEPLPEELDSLVLGVVDSLAVQLDSLALSVDSLAVQLDSLAVKVDSLVVATDSVVAPTVSITEKIQQMKNKKSVK